MLLKFKEFISIEKPNTGHTHLKSLDGLRGLSFLMILLTHISNKYEQIGFRGLGRVAVWLFLVLSAFLLTNYFISRPEKTKQIMEWLNYGFRRIVRIVPLYFLILIIYCLFNYIITDANSILQHLFLQKGNGHFWTIPIEMKYYLVIPFVVFLLVATRRNPLLTLLGFITFTVIHQLYIPASTTEDNSIKLISYLPVFIAGSVASVFHNYLNSKILGKTIRITFDVISLSILLFIFLTTPSIWSVIVKPIPSNYFYRDFVYFGCALAALIVLILHGEGYIRRIFESPILTFYGNISYSAYLIHPLILNALYKSMPRSMFVPSALLMVFCTTITSIFLYILIERHCIKVNLFQLLKLKDAGDQIRYQINQTK